MVINQDYNIKLLNHWLHTIPVRPALRLNLPLSLGKPSPLLFNLNPGSVTLSKSSGITFKFTDMKNLKTLALIAGILVAVLALNSSVAQDVVKPAPETDVKDVVKVDPQGLQEIRPEVKVKPKAEVKTRVKVKDDKRKVKEYKQETKVEMKAEKFFKKAVKIKDLKIVGTC